jgi:hypothetical protein
MITVTESVQVSGPGARCLTQLDYSIMALNALMSLFVKVSQIWARGVRFQQKNLTRWVGVAHKMDFLSTVLAFSCTPISVQDSGFGIH